MSEEQHPGPLMPPMPMPPKPKRPSKYHRRIRDEWVDVYDILAAYNTGSAAIDHAIKKLLVPGGRSGGKSRVQDIEEAIWSLQRALEKERENGS